MFSFASLPRHISKNFHLSFIEILLSNNLLAKFVLCSCFAILIVLMDSFLRCLYNLHESSVFKRFALLCARFLLQIALLTWLFSQGGADGRIVTNLFGMDRLQNYKSFSVKFDAILSISLHLISDQSKLLTY